MKTSEEIRVTALLLTYASQTVYLCLLHRGNKFLDTHQSDNECKRFRRSFISSINLCLASPSLSPILLSETIRLSVGICLKWEYKKIQNLAHSQYTEIDPIRYPTAIFPVLETLARDLNLPSK